jgi:hypothetical protein
MLLRGYNAKDDYPPGNKTDSNAAPASRRIFCLLPIKSTNFNSYTSLTNRFPNNSGSSYIFTRP